MVYHFREIVFRFREIIFNSMYGGCLCTRCILYDGQEVTYTPHMLKLCCVRYTYGKPLIWRLTIHFLHSTLLSKVRVLDVVLEV